MSRGHAQDHAAKEAELSAALKQVEAELVQAKAVGEELRLLVAALEGRLDRAGNDLAANNQKLRLESHTRVEDQREIRRLRENLVHREHAFAMVNEELESLSYGISHDLRSPLRHLIGFSDALLEDCGDTLDESTRGYLDCIIRAGRKMESLIEALLKLSRITRKDLIVSAVDLSELARSCAASLQSSSPERNTVFRILDELPVLADLELMRSAVSELVSNAWKFTRGNEQAVIEVGRKQEGSSTVYVVRDNGVGFDMQYAGKLFAPFQRMHGDGEFEGTGIGLAVVQRIIHRHGGRIWAEASVGAGASFYFTLPDRTTLDR